MRTYGKARPCDCFYNVCRSNAADKSGNPLNTGRHRTRKDWRMRCWPSGNNDSSLKCLYRQHVRRLLKRGKDEYASGNAGRKADCSYNINDFKGPSNH